MGLPVIATNWSGSTAFLSENCSLPLRIDGVRELSEEDAGDNLRGHRWAEPSISHLKQLMRWAYTHPAEARALGTRARQEMVRRFSPSAIARQHLLPALRRAALRMAETLQVKAKEEQARAEYEAAHPRMYIPMNIRGRQILEMEAPSGLGGSNVGTWRLTNRHLQSSAAGVRLRRSMHLSDVSGRLNDSLPWEQNFTGHQKDHNWVELNGVVPPSGETRI